MAIQVNIHQAKTHLSRLLERVAAGEEIIIAKSNTPVARLTAIGNSGRQRILGRDRGSFEVPEDFDDPLPEEITKAFES